MNTYEVVFRDEHADFAPEYVIMEIEGRSPEAAIRKRPKKILSEIRKAIYWVDGLTDGELADLVYLRPAIYRPETCMAHVMNRAQPSKRGAKK